MSEKSKLLIGEGNPVVEEWLGVTKGAVCGFDVGSPVFGAVIGLDECDEALW
jgi:hypothetical protein